METPLSNEYLRFLSEPASFPDKPAAVQVVQTHISIIAITDHFVYKLKKEVRFDFLDFSTLEKRKWYCEEEIRLNSRLARNLYVQLLPVYQQQGKLSFTPGGEIVNYVIQMHRLADEGLLVHLVQRSDFSLKKLDTLAETLIAFYQNQSGSEEKIAYGSAEQFRKTLREVTRPFPDFIKKTLSPLAASLLKTYFSSFLQKNASWFVQRQQTGKIIQGHGDLRSEHIHFQDDTITIYDCIEFSQPLRCLDWLNDVAFLLMDLEYRHCVPYAAYLRQKLVAALETESVDALLNFYKTYRACVRGKVNSLKSEETEVPTDVRQESREKAQRYFQLALRYTVLQSVPTLVVCMGGVATGKTTLAAALATELGLYPLSSDVIRKQLVGIDPLERLPDEDRPRLYTPQMTEQVYGEMHRRGLAEVTQNGAVVLDATYRQPEKLQALQTWCTQQKIQLRVIEATASPETIRKRLAARDTKATASDMRLSEYSPERFLLGYTPERYAGRVLKVETDAPVQTLLETYILPWLGGQV